MSLLRAGVEASPSELDDLEHERILAAVNHGLFGTPVLQIGSYRIIRLLGAGGMGEVFLARDESLDRDVAIKLLSNTIVRGLGAQHQVLLQSEARALARLSHPNVVQVHEFGEYRGRSYVVMEYVRGPTLRGWLRAEARRTAEILDVLRSAGAGLAAAHEVGIVHRDFKPENVLVGDDGRPRVVDFGLAQTDSAAAGLAGTPRYMAPEQRRRGVADARSDQYAFCLTLFEALEGRLPSSPDSKDVRFSGPRWIRRCLRRGLDPEPTRRWPDLPQLLVALDPRARRRTLTIGVGTSLCLGIGLAWLLAPSPDPCEVPEHTLATTWDTERAAMIERRFVELDAGRGPEEEALVRARLDAWSQDWRRARTSTCRARRAGRLSETLEVRRELCLARQRRLVAAMVTELAEADRRTLAHARELVAGVPAPAHCEDDERLHTGLGSPSPSEAAALEHLELLLARATARRLGGHPQRSIAELERVEGQVEQLGDAPIAKLLAERASAEFMAGTPYRGQALLERAAHHAYVGKDDRLAAYLWTELVWHAVSDQPDLEAAERWLERADEGWTRVGANANAQAKLAFARGAVALEQEHFAQAKDELGAALLALDEPETDQGLRHFILERQAELEEARGRTRPGLELRELACDVSEQHFGPTHQRAVMSRLNFALALYTAGEPDRAELELERALAQWQLGGGSPTYFRLADAHQLRAGLALDDDEFDRAVAEAQQALDILLEARPEAVEALAYAHYTLATIAYVAADYDIAAVHFGHARALLVEARGASDADAVSAAVFLGLAELAGGELERARASLTAALNRTDEFGVLASAARLGLLELELRAGSPSAARIQLDAIDAELAPPAELALLAALTTLRSGAIPDTTTLQRALSSADAATRNDLSRLVARLELTTTELDVLQLDALQIDHR